MQTIAQRYHCTHQQLFAWNQLQGDRLNPGQKLVIWRQTNGDAYYTVKQGQSFHQIASMHHLSADMLYRLNPQKIGKMLHPGDKIRVV